MRPKKQRWIRCKPGTRCFRPCGKRPSELEGVVITLDEYEALRLTHLEGKEQAATAKMMGVHSSTVCRILQSANKKLTDALVNLKAIKVEGGNCKVIVSKKCR